MRANFTTTVLALPSFCTKPRPDKLDVPLPESDRTLFVDGSCLRDRHGILRAAYGVCTLSGVLEASYLCHVSSPQVAKLIALTRSCCNSEGSRVTIYSDIYYGFRVWMTYDVCGHSEAS